MLVFLFMCSHGRTLHRPSETYYIYIYIDKERKETERRSDTETNIVRGKDYIILLKSCSTIQRISFTWLQKYDIANQFYNVG